MKNIMNSISKNLGAYSTILIIVLSWQICGIGKVDLRLSQGIDQQIMLLTSAKMHYFDISSYQAAWNHHSPILFVLTKLTYFFVNFTNASLGFYALYTIILLLISFFLFKILYEFFQNKIIAISGSLIFIFDISSSTIGGNVILDNRTIGILFQAIILINCLKYIKSKKNTYLYLIAIFSVIQIYNLESYAAAILCIYLYLIYIENNYVKFFTHSTIGSLLTILYISIINILNGELDEFFDLNIIFHLDSIGLTNKFENISIDVILKNLFIGGNTNLSFFVSLFIVLFIFVNFLIKYRSASLDKNEKFIYVLLFGEILHLFLTGPRFVSYSQILVLPIYILFFVGILRLFDKIKQPKIFGYFVFFIIFFLLQFGDVVLNRTSLIDGTFGRSIESHKLQAEKPDLILTWVDINSYDKLFFKNNSLPATRLWWWHQMKFVDKFYDKTYKMFDDSLLEDIFIKDLYKEKPNLAIIDTSITNPPSYFSNYIDENFELLKIDGNIEIYQLSK